MTLTESSRKGNALAQFRQVYRWQLKRNRLMSILCMGLTLICFTVVHLVQSAWSRNDYFSSPSDYGEHPTEEYLLSLFSNSAGYDLSRNVAMILIPLLLIFLVVCTVQTFQYMHKRRSVDLFHALPIRRTPLLLGSLAAIGTMLGGVTILNLLICGGVDMAMGACGDYNWGWLLGQLGYLLLLLAASLCGTVFLLVSCGTVSSAVMAGILLTVGWPVLVICGASIIEGSLPGCTLGISPAMFTALTPYLALLLPYFGNGQGIFAYLLSGGYYDDSAAFVDSGVTVWLVLWWALVTVVLLIGCVLVYRKRKSEAAENNFAYPLLRFAIRFLVSAAVGLAFAIFFGNLSNSNVVFYVTALLAAALAHVVIQVVWVRGLRQLSRSMVAYGGLVVVMALFFVGVATGGLGYVNRMPAVDEVDYIRVDIPFGIHYDDSKETYLANRSRNLNISSKSEEEDYHESDISSEESSFYLNVEPKLQTKKSIQTVQTLHQAFIAYYQGPYLPVQEMGDYTCTITYYLKNGDALTRNYHVPGDGREIGELSEYTTEPYGTPELRANMASVVALEEYQAFTLIDLYTADRVDSVELNQSDEDGSDVLFGKPAEELTEKQKKQLWNTFLQELNSEDFAWTYQERQDVANEKRYYITVESEWDGKDWPQSLTELVKNCSESGEFDAKIQPKVVLYDDSYFYVPKSCTKTRALIKELIGDHIQQGDQYFIE